MSNMHLISIHAILSEFFQQGSVIFFLTILYGVCWSVTYLNCILIGFKQKTYSIPKYSIGLNVAWESIYSFAFLFIKKDYISAGIDITWLLLDIIVLYTLIRYGRGNGQSKRNFYIEVVFLLVLSYIVQVSFLLSFPFYQALAYIAFLQNLLMSIFFIVMLYRRHSSKGQSLIIAYSKWIGTLAGTIACFSYRFVAIVGSMCAFFDIIYIILLSKTLKKEREQII